MTEIVGGGGASGEHNDNEFGAQKGEDTSKALFREYFMKQLLDIELSSMGGGDDDEENLAIRSGPRMSEFSRRSKYIKS
jgi:hypothetical protein